MARQDGNGSPIELTGADRFGGVMLTACLAGLVALAFGSWTALVRGDAQLGTWSRLRERAARALSGAGFFCAFVGVAFLEGFAWSGGSPFTFGALEFFVNGFEHLAWPLLRVNGDILLILLAGAGVLALGCVSFVARSPVVAGGSRRPFRLVATSSALSCLLVFALLDAGPRLRDALHSSPVLAFLDSIGERRREAREQETPDGMRPRRGAARRWGRLWREASRAAEGPRPNVIIMMLESVSARHLGYSGYPREVSPNLDRIAADAVNFTGARTTATHSNYAQMAVLSSLFPRRSSGLDTYRRLDYPRVLWHDLLSVIGYRTATFSSQDERWQGMIRFQATETPTELHHAGNYDGPRIDMGTEKVVPDHVTRERVIEFMREQDGPWGLYVNFQATHFPYKLPDEIEKPYQPWRPHPRTFTYLRYPRAELSTVRNKYDNALRYVDAQIGAIYDHLVSTNQLDDTLWIITSDHGELFFDHEMVTHGRSLFDAEARVPLLIHWPKRLPPAEIERVVSHLDVMPTLAELLELEPHPSFQGQSLLDPADEKRAVFLNIQGMRSQDAVICWPYKLIHDRATGHRLLFDLETDPDEVANLERALPDVTASLGALLKGQLSAQMAYHHPRRAEERTKRYAPRMASCPSNSTEPSEQLSLR